MRAGLVVAILDTAARRGVDAFGLQPAVIEVSEHVTVERLVEVALALRGPGCSTRLIVAMS